jgi:2-keto-4-pentenoate hydratase
MSADGTPTTLTDAEVSKLAADLYQARQTRVAIPPLTDERPGLTMADAYRIQEDLLARLVADGERVVGFKLGLTSAISASMRG